MEMSQSRVAQNVGTPSPILRNSQITINHLTRIAIHLVSPCKCEYTKTEPNIHPPQTRALLIPLPKIAQFVAPGN